MSNRSVAEAQGRPRWLTTGDVAKVLGVTTRWVRWLARMREVPCEVTESGLRVFQRSEVERVLIQRQFVAARSRPRQLVAVRCRMLKAGFEPRQMSLLPRPLKLVRSAGERPDPQAEVKASESRAKPCASGKAGSVNRKIASGRR